MDAWRYRHLDSGAFDRFWTSLVAEGAALGEGLQLTFEQGIAARGSRARFTVRDRRLEPRAIVEASAVANCETGTHAIRLWPGGTAGEFVGEVPAAQQGECTVEATVDGRTCDRIDRDRRSTGARNRADACEARASGARVRGRGRKGWGRAEGGPGDRGGRHDVSRCLRSSDARAMVDTSVRGLPVRRVVAAPPQRTKIVRPDDLTT